MKGIWITWENQRRNQGISKSLAWPLYEIISTHPRLLRYLISSLKTFAIIVKEKPQIIIAQNPSIILALFLIFLRNIFRYIVVIDAHNSGLFPLEGKYGLLTRIAQWIQHVADLTIVSNNFLKNVVLAHGGKAFVLPDKLPDIPLTNYYPLLGRINIIFICTFSPDEPFLEVFKAARLVPEGVYIYVTGNYKDKVNKDLIPNNVKLLGYVDEEAFWDLLFSADIVMDLTLRENCLVCGAYEGLSLRKPLILSDTRVLKSYFRQGCIYVMPDRKAIASGINEAIDKIEILQNEITCLNEIICKRWDNKFSRFESILTRYNLIIKS